MHIKNKDDLFKILQGKILKYRKKAIRKLKNAFLGLSKKDFQPFELETAVVSEKTLVSEKAFYALISRHDVLKLKGKDVEEFEFREGKTTVAHIVSFFFPQKPPKKKKRRR